MILSHEFRNLLQARKGELGVREEMRGYDDLRSEREAADQLASKEGG